MISEFVTLTLSYVLIQMLEFDSRCFTDIANVHTKISYEFRSATYYAAGKLAFNLLMILLSEIQALRGSTVHELTALLRSSDDQGFGKPQGFW
jgi:low affinity Fe/Cu permease